MNYKMWFNNGDVTDGNANKVVLFGDVIRITYPGYGGTIRLKDIDSMIVYDADDVDIYDKRKLIEKKNVCKILIKDNETVLYVNKMRNEYTHGEYRKIVMCG